MARKISNEIFYNSLTKGELMCAMQCVAEDKKNLSLQIRKDYLNIYYRGGNILKINGVNSFFFNENYFGKENPNRKGEKEKLVDIFRSKNYKVFFDNAKSIMDKWLDNFPKPEREEQHKLIVENSDEQIASDFVIIDIEFEVSTEAEYKSKRFICNKKGQEFRKKPRFDIIAIRKKDNMLCVIELKKGTKALKNNSGIDDHLEDFDTSIGNNPQPFIEEITILLKQKQTMGLLDRKLKISNNCKKPLFMFAYSYNSEDELNQYKDIHGKSNCKDIPTIKLPKGEIILLENNLL